MNFARLARRLVPVSIRKRLRSWDHLFLGRHYRRVKLSESEIAGGGYKQFIGDGEEWDLRGEFQLRLLQTLGLRPEHTFLDIGCGPIRAGRFVIDYLESGRYFGMDYNPDFIRAAEHVVAEAGLSDKAPRLRCVDDFDLTRVDVRADYALAFSVLNHCNAAQRRQFFGNIAKVLRPGGRVYLTHAFWFEAGMLEGSGMQLGRSLVPGRGDLADLSVADWGWREPGEISPIQELTSSG